MKGAMSWRLLFYFGAFCLCQITKPIVIIEAVIATPVSVHGFPANM